MDYVSEQSQANRQHRSPRGLVFFVCLLSAIALQAPAVVANTQEFTFDIKPQRTDGALFQLADTAEIPDPVLAASNGKDSIVRVARHSFGP